MIDWDQPVETDEDNPRPVRVLATDGPTSNAPIVLVICDQLVREYTTEGRFYSANRHGLPNVRNVKPKPVLRSGWVNLHADGWMSQGFVSERAADSRADQYLIAPRVECRRITWMSDGSPVPGDDDGWAMADHIKALEAKVADLQAVVDAAKLSAETAWGAANDIQDARRAAINSMKPVVDAAVVWSRASHSKPLMDAVRTYLENVKNG